MKKLFVTYTVQYTTEIEVEENLDETDGLEETYSDDLSDIDIPESESSQYKADSFCVDDVEEVSKIPVGGSFPNME